MTLREVFMSQKAYEYRLAREWDMAASLMALLANVNSSKGKTLSPNDFHPLLDVTSGPAKQVTSAEEREALFEKLKKF